ncbi:MAG: hypothetical protein ACK4QL_11370 [Pseudanabaenaceae cyanobacterium]
MKKLYLLFTIALLVAVTIVGCQFFESPEAAAKESVDSLVAGDFERLRSRICSAQAQTIKDEEVQRVQEEFRKAEIKVDTSELSFSSEIDGDTALVKPHGKVKIESKEGSLAVDFDKGSVQLRFPQGQGSMEIDLDQAPLPKELKQASGIKMVKEDGVWKFCP